MSQEFFRKTLNLFESFGEPHNMPLDYATVTTKHLGDGVMKIVSVGHDYSIILHPELIDKICSLDDGGHTVIRDETGTQYGVTVDRGDVVFTNPRAGVNCFVELDTICDDMYESRTNLSEGTWSLPDTPEKVKGLARLLSKPLHIDAATHALYNYIGDDRLYDMIGDMQEFWGREDSPETDIGPYVIDWLKQNADHYPGVSEVLELLGEPLNELSQKTLKNYRGKAERKLSDISKQSYSGKPIDIRDKMSTMRGLDRASRKIQEVLTPDQQSQMTDASPGVAQAQTNPTQAANTFKQTATTANSAATNANAAAGGMQAVSQKLDQIQAQPQAAPKKAVAPMAQNKPTDGQYVIKKGDTLSAIAKANGTTVQDIMALNKQIKDPNRIAAGAGLTLPQKAAPAGGTQPNPTPGNPQINRPMTQDEFAQLRVPKTAQAQPQQAAPQGMLAQAKNYFSNKLAANAARQAEFDKQQAAKTAPPTQAGGIVAAESINIGTIVKITTAPGMLSKARVTAINEGQYTVQTRSGTQYTVGFDDLWVKNPVMESKIKESGEEVWTVTYHNAKGKAESERDFTSKEAADAHAKKGNAKEKGGGKYKVTKTRGVNEAAKPDFLDLDKDGNKKEPMKKAAKKKLKESVDLDAWMQEYNDNEENNYHSENILLVAELVGTPDQIKVAQQCIDARDRAGYLPPDCQEVQANLQRKLWPKVRELFTQEYRKNKTMHEGDDVMGYTGPSEYETNQYTARELLQQARGWIEQGEDFGTVREILMAMVDDGAASPSDVKKVLAKINNELLEADCTGLGEKARSPKMPRGPVVEGETCCTVKYKMKKSDPKITVAEYDSREAAEKFLASVKAKGGNGIISDKKKLDELSKDTLKSYTKKAKDDLRNSERIYGHERAYEKDPRNQASWRSQPGGEAPSEYFRKSAEKRSQGIDRAIGKLEEKVDLGEKAVSKKQQQFMGMVHAAQKGEKPASKKVADVAKTMKKGDVTDFAKTKHKGLPKKVEKTDESTCAGSIAVVEPTEHYGNEANMKNYKVGQGVYESKNTHLEKMISESMSINVSLSTDPTGKPTKSININATDEDAEQLSRILNLAGIETGQPQQTAVIAIPADGEVEMPLEENMPDWPTNTEVSNDPFQYSGGLNKPKVTGQTTGAPVNVSPARGSFNENVELERTLFRLYQNYKGE